MNTSPLHGTGVPYLGLELVAVPVLGHLLHGILSNLYLKIGAAKIGGKHAKSQAI